LRAKTEESSLTEKKLKRPAQNDVVEQRPRVRTWNQRPPPPQSESREVADAAAGAGPRNKQGSSDIWSGFDIPCPHPGIATSALKR